MSFHILASQLASSPGPELRRGWLQNGCRRLHSLDAEAGTTSPHSLGKVIFMAWPKQASSTMSITALWPRNKYRCSAFDGTHAEEKTSRRAAAPGFVGMLFETTHGGREENKEATARQGLPAFCETHHALPIMPG